MRLKTLHLHHSLASHKSLHACTTAGKRQYDEEILSERDRQDGRFSVFCRHQVVTGARCSARRGVETGINEGKRIQTLFLEMAENPPQLRHMTFRKGNATLLPPATQLAVAHSRLRDFPASWNGPQPSAAGSHPRRRAVAFSRILNDCDIANS